MKIQVRFFASLREATGSEQLEIDLPLGSTTKKLLAVVVENVDESARELILSDNVRIAVNQELTEAAVTLSDGDEVALMPPITGG